MRKTVFLLGPTDRQLQQSRDLQVPATGGDMHQTNLAGILPILHFVMNDPKLKDRCMWFLIGKHKIEIPPGYPFNLFNLVGDANASRTMLRNVQAIAGKKRPVHFFNDPVNVFRTSREALPATLAGIPRCKVPRVQAADPASFDELEYACRDFDGWPLILRARGYHGGKHMVRLQGPEDLPSVRDLAWAYDGILLMEYVDSRRADGLFQKIRVVMVDGEPYLRHAIISDRWSIHSGSRSDLMNDALELCRQEEEFLSHMDRGGLRALQDIFQTIHARIGLDVFGVDFALNGDDVVVFEANACMNFLHQDYGEDNRYAYLAPYVKALQRAIRKLLLRA